MISPPLPAARFEHLARMANADGLFEHALLTEPRRDHGYCLDDVSRGLVVAAREPERTSLVDGMVASYLEFTTAARALGGGHMRIMFRHILPNSLAPILVVTEGPAGSRVYWNGDVRYFTPPAENELDPVGAGDVFAASFFIKLHQTKDPWEAARFATLVGANSVTRVGIQGVPTPQEIRAYNTEIIGHPLK